MASGNFTGTTSNNYITARVLWSSIAYPETNTSDVTVTLQVKKSTDSSGTTYGTGAWTVLINGTTYDFSATVSIPPNNTYVTIYTKTVKGIAHNSDGTKSILLGWSGGISGTSYTTTNIANTTVALDTIARASTISSFSFTNGYIEQGIDLTISSKVSTYYHDIHIYLPDTSGTGINLFSTTNGRKAGGTHHINFTDDQLDLIYKAMPSKTSSQFTVYVKTYTNATSSTEIGDWQNKSATGNISENVKPKILELAHVSSVTTGTFANLYVQGKTTVKLTCSAEMGSGATVSSYAFSGPHLSANSTNNTATSGTITSSGKLTYTVTVTDSRGRKASTTTQIDVYPYSQPSFKSTMVNRSNSAGVLDSSGTYAKYTVEGSYSSVGGKNTRTITIAHSSNNGSTYSAETTIQAATNLNTIISNVYGSGALSTTSSYIIRFTIKDGYGATATSILTLSTVSRAINIKSDNNGIAFGKIAEGNGIETPWDITFKGSGQKSLIFESGSSSAWKTQLYKGGTSDSVVIGLHDSTNSRNIWSYTNNGNFNINRPTVLNGGMSYVSIATNTDLNNMKTPGFYKCPADVTVATLKNCPVGNAFSLVVEEHAGVKQTLTAYMTGNQPIIFVRNFYNTTWGAWCRLGYSGESTTIWTGAIRTGTITLNESYKNFSFLTCVLGTAEELWGIPLGAYWDSQINELHFGAVYIGTDGIAGGNLYAARFGINSNTSLTLSSCGTKAGPGAYLRKIVGWR